MRLNRLFFIFLFFGCLYAEDEITKNCYCPKTMQSKVILKRIIISENIAYLRSSELEKTGEDWKSHVEIVDLWVPKQRKLEEQLEVYIGRCINQSLLNDVKCTVVQYYDSCGYPFVKVVIPSNQDITNGVLKVLVSLNRVNNIKCEGSKHFSDKYISSQFRVKEDDLVEINQMANELEWINQNPFRTTTLTLLPADEFGKTDLVLKTCDKFPVKVYTGYENTGNQVGGSSRFLAVINLGNVLGKGHQWNNLFISGADVSKFWLISSSYIIPTTWKGKFEFYGSFTKARPNPDSRFTMDGKGWQVAGRYRQYFNRHYEFFVGYEFKRTNNFLTFSDQLSFDQYFDISQFLIGLEINYKYRIGNTFFGIILYGSPGDMTVFNKDSIFNQERGGAIANYIYGKLRLEQLFYLPYDFILFFNGAFQQSTSKLLPSEEFSIGGFYTVRGYEENEAIGDNGALLRTELRLPGIKSYYKACKKLKHNLQFLGFVDFGYVYDADKNLVNKDTVFLASVGPGLRYFFRENLQARFDYGFQLSSITRNDQTGKRHSRGHVGVILSF